MKIVTYNINGVRSAHKKGLFEWIEKVGANIICIQEVRAAEQIAKTFFGTWQNQVSLFENELFLGKYYVTYNCGFVSGYAGTLMLSTEKPERVVFGIPTNNEADDLTQRSVVDPEGRCITAYFKNCVVVNCYVPNGGTRLDFKMDYFEKLTNYLGMLKQKNNVIFCSDANISHTELDLTHPKECASRTGFLPVEREAFSKLINLGFCDVARLVFKGKILYTWRSYKSRIVGGDYGWKYRFDYVLVSDNLKNKIESCEILDLEYSDHMPIVANIDV